MFTPTEIEALPSAMEQLYRSLQLNIMSDLTERLKANGEEITSAADWQINRLYELGVSKDEIDSLIQSTLDVSDDEIDRIYDEVVKSGYARNEELYTSKGKEHIPYAENKQLQQLVKAVKNQTKSEYRNITGSLGFAVRNPDNTVSFTPLAKFYQDTLDNGLMQIASGAVDYNTVLKRAVKAMTDSGLRTVDYASGWSNRVDVAARRALMTGFNQVVAKVNEDNAEQLGTEYFEVSYHRGARPTHQVWQGRVYSKKELETVCGLGTVTGLCGANCYHSYSPFIKGIDTPTYSEEELDRMNEEENAPKEYNGKTYTAYEAQQRQRRLETAMRADRQKIELLTQGGADDDTITGAKAKYFQRQDEYVKFSKAMNLPQQWERITVDGKNALGSKLPKKAGNINKISGEKVAKSAEIKKPKKIGADEIAENTTKLKGAMTETDYNEFTKLLADSENESVKKLYVQYADEVGEVLYKENQGGYMPTYNRLIFSYEPQWIIDSGVSKYSTVAHEYAHFFDQKAEFEGLHFSEIDTIVEHTKYQKFMLKKVASSSDEFLEAARKDREFLESLYDQDPYELRKELLAHNGLSGSVQDAFDGLLGVRIKQGHGNSYYNKKFQIAKEQKDIQGIKVAYKEIGIDASNQGKVMREYRVFDASSEMWANIMSAEVNGGAELEYIKKYLPNSYNAMRKIVDNAKFSGDTVEKSVDYMSKSFRPKFSPPSSIDFNNNSIKIKKVENSKFDIVTDIENTRRNKAVRLTEKLLDSISNNLPVEMELPKVAVIDFEKNNFGIDAIGGYDKSTGILYINSKYDTASKIISYVNKQKDMFANKTEFAPLLHELGHKYYYDSIKNLAKVKNIEYNKAKGIIDEKILSYIQNKGISKNLDTLISEYAQSGYDRHKYTEIVAEVFTVPEKELASDLINLVGE